MDALADVEALPSYASGYNGPRSSTGTKTTARTTSASRSRCSGSLTKKFSNTAGAQTGWCGMRSARRSSTPSMSNTHFGPITSAMSIRGASRHRPLAQTAQVPASHGDGSLGLRHLARAQPDAARRSDRSWPNTNWSAACGGWPMPRSICSTPEPSTFTATTSARRPAELRPVPSRQVGSAHSPDLCRDRPCGVGCATVETLSGCGCDGCGAQPAGPRRCRCGRQDLGRRRLALTARTTS